MTGIIRRCWHCEREFVVTDPARRFCTLEHWRAWKKKGERPPPWIRGSGKTRRFSIPGVDAEAPSPSWRNRKRPRCTKCGQSGHNARTCNVKED